MYNQSLEDFKEHYYYQGRNQFRIVEGCQLRLTESLLLFTFLVSISKLFLSLM